MKVFHLGQILSATPKANTLKVLQVFTGIKVATPLIIASLFLIGCGEVRMPPKPKPVLACPVCLEVKVYKKGEPEYWTSDPDQIFRIDGSSLTIHPNRYVSTRYICHQGHQFETTCNQGEGINSHCSVYICHEKRVWGHGCLLDLEEDPLENLGPGSSSSFGLNYGSTDELDPNPNSTDSTEIQ